MPSKQYCQRPPLKGTEGLHSARHPIRERIWGYILTKRNVLETVTVFAVAAFALTAFVPAASAQGKTFSFLVPFDFYAGAILMPAGEYTVSQTPFTRATQIYDRKGHAASILHIVATSHLIGNNRMILTATEA